MAFAAKQGGWERFQITVRRKWQLFNIQKSSKHRINGNVAIFFR